MSDQLSMIPGDVDVLSLFDQPAPVAKASAPLANVDRCPACHGRLDGRSPRCLCAIQPEGAAEAQELAPVAALDNVIEFTSAWLAKLPDVVEHQDDDLPEWDACPDCGSTATLCPCWHAADAANRAAIAADPVGWYVDHLRGGWVTDLALAAGTVTAAAETLRGHLGTGHAGGGGPGYVYQAETSGVRIGSDHDARTTGPRHTWPTVAARLLAADGGLF